MSADDSPVHALLASYRDGQLLPVDKVRALVERIDRRNGVLHALREVDAQAAIARARSLEAESDRMVSLPLFGVPLAIKDNVSQAGRPNRAGRQDSAGGPAAADATIVRRLLQAGAIILARATMDELAYGVTGCNPYTGQVRNPCREELHPGGSSAGSAAAVADGMVPLAVGTDSAGSVRIPAALCGLVGMRPTHGLVPTAGIAPLAPSLDTVGAIAHSVADAGLLLAVLAGRPDLASATRPDQDEVRSRKVIALQGTFAVDVAEAIQALFAQACRTVAGLVASLQQAAAAELATAPSAAGPIIGAEAASAWQAELDAHPDWFGDEVAGYLAKGAAITAIRFLRAQQECATVVRAIDRLFERADVLMLPTTAIVATPVAAPGPQLPFLELTVPFSLGGYPAITVPMGEAGGMPAGLQLVARRGQDALLLEIAAAFEQARR